MGHRLLPFAPALYHGTEKSCPYFEGWYYKLALPGDSLAVIPGIFRSRHSPQGDISFIQVLYGRQSAFIRYPPEAFRAHPHSMDIQIGNSRFTMDGLHLDITTGGLTLQGRARFTGVHTLKTHPLSPSIMGPFSFLPGMQCNHGLLSLEHTVWGILRHNETTLRLEGAKGYIEKDWGSAFPSAWVWLQGHASGQDASFTCSAATIPLGPIRFNGLICVLRIGEDQIRMATYLGGRVSRLCKTSSGFALELRQGPLCLSLSAQAEQFGTLQAPTRNGMDRSVTEALDATFELTLQKRNHLLFSGRFEHGGMELSNIEALTRP